MPYSLNNTDLHLIENSSVWLFWEMMFIHYKWYYGINPCNFISLVFYHYVYHMYVSIMSGIVYIFYKRCYLDYKA